MEGCEYGQRWFILELKTGGFAIYLIFQRKINNNKQETCFQKIKQDVEEDDYFYFDITHWMCIEYKVYYVCVP